RVIGEPVDGVLFGGFYVALEEPVVPAVCFNAQGGTSQRETIEAVDSRVDLELQDDRDSSKTIGSTTAPPSGPVRATLPVPVWVDEWISNVSKTSRQRGHETFTKEEILAFIMLLCNNSSVRELSPGSLCRKFLETADRTHSHESWKQFYTKRHAGLLKAACAIRSQQPVPDQGPEPEVTPPSHTIHIGSVSRSKESALQKAEGGMARTGQSDYAHELGWASELPGRVAPDETDLRQPTAHHPQHSLAFSSTTSRIVSELFANGVKHANQFALYTEDEIMGLDQNRNAQSWAHYFKRHFPKIVAAVDSQLQFLGMQADSRETPQLSDPLASQSDADGCSVDGESLITSETQDGGLFDIDDTTDEEGEEDYEDSCVTKARLGQQPRNDDSNIADENNKGNDGSDVKAGNVDESGGHATGVSGLTGFADRHKVPKKVVPRAQHSSPFNEGEIQRLIDFLASTPHVWRSQPSDQSGGKRKLWRAFSKGAGQGRSWESWKRYHSTNYEALEAAANSLAVERKGITNDSKKCAEPARHISEPQGMDFGLNIPTDAGPGSWDDMAFETAGRISIFGISKEDAKNHRFRPTAGFTSLCNSRPAASDTSGSSSSISTLPLLSPALLISRSPHILTTAVSSAESHQEHAIRIKTEGSDRPASFTTEHISPELTGPGPKTNFAPSIPLTSSHQDSSPTLDMESPVSKAVLVPQKRRAEDDASHLRLAKTSVSPSLVMPSLALAPLSNHRHSSPVPSPSTLKPNTSSFPRSNSQVIVNTLLVPVHAAVLSMIILVLQTILQNRRVRRVSRWLCVIETEQAHDATPESSWYRRRIQNVLKAHGSLTAYLFNALRSAICLTLLGLSIYAADFKSHDGQKGLAFKTVQTAQIIFYLYTSLLGLLTVLGHHRTVSLTSTHLAMLLLVAFGVFFYRDVIPLAMIFKVPQDAADGWVTWLQVALLSLAGVIIPVITPRRYSPVDPLNPAEPAPEQTASLLSLTLFNYVDAVISKGYRQSHVRSDELPPVPDYDHVGNLARRAFPHLDPLVKVGKPRHIFFGLMWVYKWDYSMLAILLVMKSCAALIGPFAMNHLLQYLESGGKGATYHPWVWILGLFIGPFLGSILWEVNIAIGTRLLVRTEGLITQLIFERALKMRFTDDSQKSTPSDTPREAAVVLDDEMVTERTGRAEGTDSSDVTLTGGLEAGDIDSKTKGKDRSPTSSGSDSPRKSTATPIKEDAPKKKDEKKESKNLVGKLTNMVSTDLKNLTNARNFIMPIIWAPVQLTLSIWLLYELLGWSAFVGLATMILTIPIPGKLVTLLHGLQVEQMKKTDARVQSITESINVIRMIKLFGWENRVNKQIEEKRDEELKYIRRRSLWNLGNFSITQLLPLLVSITTFATFTLIMKQDLTASRIFSSIAVFDLITEQLYMTFHFVTQILAGKVSIDRINAFIKETDLLDRFTKPEQDISVSALPPTGDPDSIGFRNATFAWKVDSGSAGSSGTTTPSQRNFQLRVDGDLFFKKGKLNLILGPTGSGKTSLLMALLGEMHFKREHIDSFLNLPREDGIAFCAQESWIQNATIKDNILFGSTFDEARYHKVVHQCALETDFQLFDAGDATEVGEKGLTLSGGQKARLALARALYSPASILLLDDILSALDVHTSRWIVDKCLHGDLIEGRTVLLVTHNIGMTAPLADFVVTVGSNGRVTSQDSIPEALSKDLELREAAQETTEVEKKEDQVVDDKAPAKEKKPSGQLIANEETAEGRIVWSAFTFFFSGFGGPLFWMTFFTCVILQEATTNFQTWFLGYWARQYEIHPGSEVNALLYLSGYSSIILVALLFGAITFLVYLFGTLRATRRTHAQLTRAILNAPLRWLDSTPSGRIISRFTQDITAIDTMIPSLFSTLIEMTTSLLLKFAAVLLYSPIFLLPGIAVGAGGAWIGSIYMKAQLPVKREMSNSRSPVYSHFNAAVAGLTSIRAYGAEEAFKSESRKRIDGYTRPARAFYDLNRWVCIRIDALGGMFASALAAYMVYWRKTDASIAGFSLTMALSFTSMLLYWVRILNMFEVEGNSLERIKAYVDIDQEPQPVDSHKPPAYWPSSGSIRVEGLSAKYSHDGPEVLHNLSFEIKAGERVGIVGRTGAGKSSLSFAFLRMIPTTGKVFYDGIDTNEINLDALRNNITIIPQQPELMSGSLRQNLDPFGEHDDATLNGCLHSSGLFSLQQDDDENKISLDTEVSSGGTNFSLGQRQIIALARAMVRRSKVYILGDKNRADHQSNYCLSSKDEATASVDYKTDTAIQEAIAKEFNDTTLIIIAHRLQTIMTADKVLVLDAGNVVEFDSPAALLEKEGTFKALVDGSGDRDALYDLVKGHEASGSSTMAVTKLLAL
ncbi:hypothetical protein FRB96_003338, partial [Tulasnella sp. 330]